MFQYYEYKYLVEANRVEFLKSILDDLYQDTDPYAKGWVHSVYFDSIDRRALAECVNGQSLKRKFRIRAYNNELNKNLQLQVKEKNLSAVSKYKEAYKGDSAYVFPGLDEIKSDEIKALASQYCNLEPLIQIDYQRSRYRVANARITLDENIIAKPLSGMKYSFTDEARFPFAVLEVKTKNERPFTPVLDLMELKQVSFSKFYLGVQYLMHELEALNKYVA